MERERDGRERCRWRERDAVERGVDGERERETVERGVDGERR